MQSATQQYSSSLAAIVCHWRPGNLPQLSKSFSAACSKPQTTFLAYEHYKLYFEPLLFAEITAELHSASDKYQRSSNTRPVKIRARREEPGSNPALVVVQRVTRNHTYGFGCTVDVEPCDKKGPVGCVDNDVVVVWVSPSDGKNKHTRSNASHQIPANAALAVVVRTPSRNGCRILLATLPNSSGRSELEEGEEVDEKLADPSVWVLLRLGSLTTLKREFDALQSIRSSVLLPMLLNPNRDHISSEKSAIESKPTDDVLQPTVQTAQSNATAGSMGPRLEKNFTVVVADKLGLNVSQTRAIIHSSTCHSGFSVIQGPPGTGKTRTLIGLLNVIHMTQYHKYYEGLLASLDTIHGSVVRKRVNVRGIPPTSEKAGDGSLLETMMIAMNKTVEAAITDMKPVIATSPTKRPRLLVCAPSNSAVDEIVTRLMMFKFFDGHGRTYCPELARIGAGDKVSEAVKALTAEGQAESFLERVCQEDDTNEAQQEAQKSYLADWQKKCNHLLVQLERAPKTQESSRALVVDIHEKLERMERDLRRLSIAVANGKNGITREDKLRLIARTYVEDAQLVFATLSGSASSILTSNSYGAKDKDACLFDTVVIDEAAQATETSCLIPMTLGCSRCLLVGDPQQLPATVLSSGASGVAYGQSLLERVFRAGLNVQLLDTQYRMHPAISSFPRRYFYSGRLIDDETVQGDHRARAFHRDALKPKLGPYVFLDISEGEEKRSKDDRSIFNPAEAELAALIYIKLKKDYPGDTLFTPLAKMPGSVTGFGVVTPYKRQMQELRQSFERAGVPTGDVEIDTVDSFQGREKDVVVFSCVRTALAERGIGFVRDVRRMNVGLTRARASLIILGSAQALAEGSKDWAELVEDASSRGCLLSVSNVERCLLIDSADTATSQLAASNLATLNAGKGDAPSSLYKASEMSSTFKGIDMKKKHGSARIDPRRRGARTITHIVKPQLNSGAQHDENDKCAVEFNGALSSGAVCGGSGSADNASETQNILAQIRNVLREVGFQDTAAVEDCLREHLRKGGGLDIETVLAAAIAASDSSPNDKMASTSTRLYKMPSHNGFDDNKNANNVENHVEDFSGNHAVNHIDCDHTAPKDVPVATTQGKNEVENTSVTEAPVKIEKESSDEKKDEKKPGEPSGWEMLFGGGSAAIAREHEESESAKRKTDDWNKGWDVNDERKEKRIKGGHRTHGVVDDSDKEDEGLITDDKGPVGPPRRTRGWHTDDGGIGRSRGRGRGRGFGRGRGRPRARVRARGFNGFNEGPIDDGGYSEWSGRGEFGYRDGGIDHGIDRDNTMNDIGTNNVVDGNPTAAAAAALGMFGDAGNLQTFQRQLLQQQMAWQQQQAFQQQAMQHQQAMLMQMSGMGGGGDKGNGWYTGGFDQMGGPSNALNMDGFTSQKSANEMEDIGRGFNSQSWDRPGSRGRPFRGGRGRPRGRGVRRR